MSLHILNNAVLALGLDRPVPLSGTWYWLAILCAVSSLRPSAQLALVFRKAAARRSATPSTEMAAAFFPHARLDHFLVLSCVCIILNFFVLGA